MLDQARLAAPFYSPKQLTAAQAFWALPWFCSPDAEETWGEEEKWVKDHRLQSVTLKFECYMECSPAAAFALQMWILLSHHAWHESTLLHGTHIWSTPGSEALASLFWCVHIRTRSGMCVETWAVVCTAHPSPGPFPVRSLPSDAREPQPWERREQNQSQMWGLTKGLKPFCRITGPSQQKEKEIVKPLSSSEINTQS